MATLARDVTRLMGRLEREGCRVTRTSRGHWKVNRPGFGQVTVGTSPSDQRAWRNIIGDIRRHLGIEI